MVGTQASPDAALRQLDGPAGLQPGVGEQPPDQLALTAPSVPAVQQIQQQQVAAVQACQETPVQCLGRRLPLIQVGIRLRPVPAVQHRGLGHPGAGAELRRGQHLARPRPGDPESSPGSATMGPAVSGDGHHRPVPILSARAVQARASASTPRLVTADAVAMLV